MGCNNCNQNNSQGQSNTATKFGELAGNDYEGHFFLKVITFLLLIIGLPFILLVLIGQVFGTFFMPTSLASVKENFSNWSKNALAAYAARKRYKEELKREKQFRNNPTYGDEISDIEIYEDIDDNNKETDEN